MSIPASEARKNLFGLIEQVNEDRQPVEITSRRGDAVLLSRADYEALAETDYLLRVPANARHLLESLAEADPGNAKSTTWTEGEAVLHAQSLGRLPVLAKDRSRHAQAPQPAAGRGAPGTDQWHRETGATTPPVGRGLVAPHHRRASVGVPDRRRRHRRAARLATTTDDRERPMRLRHRPVTVPLSWSTPRPRFASMVPVREAFSVERRSAPPNRRAPARSGCWVARPGSRRTGSTLVQRWAPRPRCKGHLVSLSRSFPPTCEPAGSAVAGEAWAVRGHRANPCKPARRAEE